VSASRCQPTALPVTKPSMCVSERLAYVLSVEVCRACCSHQLLGHCAPELRACSTACAHCVQLYATAASCCASLCYKSPLMLLLAAQVC
jgi:hypothetical protein